MSAPHLLHEFPLHYESLVRFLRRRLGCDEQAREVAHDTWMRLAERPAAGAEPIGDARSYFCTVAANLHLDQHRRTQCCKATWRRRPTPERAPPMRPTWPMG